MRIRSRELVRRVRANPRMRSCPGISTIAPMAAQVTSSDIVDIWRRHAAGDDITDALDGVRRAARSSRRSRDDLTQLDTVLGTGTAHEWSAWWQLVCGWSHGFPPHPSTLPERPTTGDRVG